MRFRVVTAVGLLCIGLITAIADAEDSPVANCEQQILETENTTTRKYKHTLDVQWQRKLKDESQCCDCPMNPTTLPTGTYSEEEKDVLTQTQTGCFSAGVQGLFEVLTFNVNDNDSYTKSTEVKRVITQPVKALRCSTVYYLWRGVTTETKVEECRYWDVVQHKWAKKTESNVTISVETKFMKLGQTFDKCTGETGGATQCEINAS